MANNKKMVEAITSRDEDFAKIAESFFTGKVVSAVYLIGDGFDGDWMKRSLTVVCRGKRLYGYQTLRLCYLGKYSG